MKRALAAVLGAGLLLAGCGQNTPTATSTTAPYADGVDHSWTASTAEGQRLYSALSQGLKSQDFNIGLSITATNGYGPIELNTSNGEYAGGDGQPITLNGQVYSAGLGVHADSEIHIHATNLETPACTRFQADVGIDDEVGDKGSVSFQVFADGLKLFDSGRMTGASATQHIDVGIGNKSDLRFVVTNGGDGYSYDHADWAGARLICESTQPTTKPSVTLDTNNLNIYHLHTGTLRATFSNYPAGTIQVALTSDPFTQPETGNRQRYPALVLQTTSVTLNGSAEETHDLVIDAPQQGVTYADPRSGFHITTSSNGTELNSIPVTLTESPLKLKAYFTQDPLVLKPGETGTSVLHMDIDPPLSYTPKMTVGLYTPSSSTFGIASQGVSTGTGASIDLPVNFSAKSDSTRYDLPDTLDLYIDLEGVGGGGRDPFYDTALRKSITLNLTR